MPNADASAGKKTSQKKKKRGAESVHYTASVPDVFETIYEQKKGDKYYYAAKDAAALKQLLNKIKFLMPEGAEERRGENWKKTSKSSSTPSSNSKILGAWITDNLSLPIINDKFNEIYSQLKNGKSSSNTADNFHVFGSRNITPDILAEFT